MSNQPDHTKDSQTDDTITISLRGASLTPLPVQLNSFSTPSSGKRKWSCATGNGKNEDAQHASKRRQIGVGGVRMSSPCRLAFNDVAGKFTGSSEDLDIPGHKQLSHTQDVTKAILLDLSPNIDGTASVPQNNLDEQVTFGVLSSPATLLESLLPRISAQGTAREYAEGIHEVASRKDKEAADMFSNSSLEAQGTTPSTGIPNPAKKRIWKHSMLKKGPQ